MTETGLLKNSKNYENIKRKKITINRKYEK